MKRGFLTLKDFQLTKMTPSGWLIDPKGDCLLLFQPGSKSSQKSIKVLMDKWDSTSHGTPSNFRNRRIVELEPAIETWNELISKGWRHVQFHEHAA